MINIKYAVLQLIRRISTTFFIILQISLAFFLMFSVIEVKNSSGKILKAIERLYNDSSDMFTIFDLDRRNNENPERKKDIFKYLDENNYKHIISDKGFIYIDKNSNIKNLKEIFLPSMFSNEYYDGKKVELDYNGYKYFRLEIMEGRGFEESDFNKIEDEYVPVIIGNKLSKNFKVGDVFLALDKDMKSNKSFKVVGILKDNLSLLSPAGEYDIVDIEDYFIIPKREYKPFEIFDGKIFFGRKSSNLNNFKDRIEQNFGDMNVSVQVNLVDENLKNIEKALNTQKSINFITFIVVLLFSSVGFISSLLYSINKRLSEFGVHLMAGGTLMDIGKRIFAEVIIQISISFILAYRFRIYYLPYKMPIKDLYDAIIYAGVICLLISIIPVRNVLTINIDQLLKGRE